MNTNVELLGEVNGRGRYGLPLTEDSFHDAAMHRNDKLFIVTNKVGDIVNIADNYEVLVWVTPYEGSSYTKKLKIKKSFYDLFKLERADIKFA